ncbi:unnamed protein product [Rotaria sp. Silwood2]|nr:unnamed protein product [Rotaria sp. Silwood2]CAF4100048.1 unnamed protein product [Rotaria sp. Silwood2]CAF4165949.1 unnamed protein product [Rotaria sp. Silwood2]CAF4236170.1 unnamed protein product [Rotaria sp. Silwood2]
MDSANSGDPSIENPVIHQPLSVDQAQQKSPNTLIAYQSLSSLTALCQASPPVPITTVTINRKKRQRCVYALKVTPYATRKRGAGPDKGTK